MKMIGSCFPGGRDAARRRREVNTAVPLLLMEPVATITTWYRGIERGGWYGGTCTARIQV